MNNRITIIVDYLGFLRREKYQSSSLNITNIKNYFIKAGYDCKVYTYQEIANNNCNICNSFILYTSSEFLSYKNYIGDNLLMLNKSNTLIPNYDFFQSHNNKGFQELLKRKYKIKSLWYHYFGTFEEIKNEIKQINFPVVLKHLDGSGGENIMLIKSKKALFKQVKKQSKGKRHLINQFKKILKRYIFKKTYTYNNSLESLYYKNFILQEYVPNLKNDWKILIFFDKYYILKREIKFNDFRASGSGKFSYENKVNSKLLDYCQKIIKSFNIPWISLDVCYYQKKFHLLEFQTMHFGPLTIMNSSHYYINKNNNWIKIKEKSDLSNEFARSFIKHLKENF